MGKPSISATVDFGQGFVPGTVCEAPGRPHHSAAVPAAGDDERVERQPILDLLDAFEPRRMMLHVNLGGHASTPRRPRTVQRMSNKMEFTSADDAA